MPSDDDGTDIEKKLGAVLEQLDSPYMPLKRALKMLEDVHDPSPDLEDKVTEIHETLQSYLALLQPFLADVTQNAHFPVPDPLTSDREPRQTAREAPLANAKNSIAQGPRPTHEKTSKANRRPRSKAFDFLLLEAFRHQVRFGYPIGQSNLFALASSFEPQTKRASLIAKLNRWKNDQNWLQWQDSDDITITPLGEAQRDKLLPIVRRDGDAEAVKKTFNAVWNLDVTWE